MAIEFVHVEINKKPFQRLNIEKASAYNNDIFLYIYICQFEFIGSKIRKMGLLKKNQNTNLAYNSILPAP